jgi:hypothetical protein
MDGSEVLQVPVIEIDIMFKACTQVSENAYCNAWLENAYVIIPRRTHIGMNHIVIKYRRCSCYLAQVQSGFEFSCQSVAKIIIPQLEVSGPKRVLLPASGTSAACTFVYRSEVLEIGILENTPPPKATVP